MQFGSSKKRSLVVKMSDKQIKDVLKDLIMHETTHKSSSISWQYYSHLL